METSLPSTSSSPPPPENQPYPPEPLTDRVLRALEHHLRLLHRSDADFFVLGSTGNVYTVTLSSAPSCTCPDRTTPCKHILFVYIRVLSVSLDDPCLWRRTLRPCQLSRLLSAPVSGDSLAGTAIRQRFHQLYLLRSVTHPGGIPPPVKAEDGSSCPVCLEDMAIGDRKLVACATCRNPIHEDCLLEWKRSSRRRSTSCVICRARWRDKAEQERYINLSAYVSEDDNSNMGQDQEGGGDAYCGVNINH